MKILLLDNYDSFTQNLKQILEESELCDFDIRENDRISLTEVAVYDKILISPGPGVPQEAGILLEIIREYAPLKSILGVCLGHQAIGEVFGAQLFNLPLVYHGQEAKIKVLDHQDVLFRKLGSELSVGLYHSWAVSPQDFPTELEIIALSESGVIMALRHKRFKVWGIQFHPESIMTSLGKNLLENWLRG